MVNPIQIIDEAELKQNYQTKFADMRIIDVRSPSEYAREHIPNSQNIPLEQLSEADLSQYKDQAVIFHCRMGHRTKMASDIIAATGLKSIYCLAGGIEQWKRCGLQVVKNHQAPIDIMRQVQIIAGLLILIGIILSYAISGYFVWLSAFVGLGLVFAGVTGFCGMAKLLAKCPWNRLSQ